MSSHFALSGGGVYSADHGQVLEAEVMRFAQILRDYNQYFELQFIPANAGDSESKPYRVVDNTPGIERNVVCYISHQEMQNPKQVLANIWKGDLRFHSPEAIINDMELQDKAAKLFELKQKEERAQEDEEMMAFYLRGGQDRKHFLRYNGQTIER